MSKAGTGIAGAMDYSPATGAREDRCFICGGPWQGGASIAARVLPPMVQVCSAECRADPRFAGPVQRVEVHPGGPELYIPPGWSGGQIAAALATLRGDCGNLPEPDAKAR